MNHLSQAAALMRWAVYKNLACQFFFSWRERITFYLQRTQRLLDFRSNSNHIQPMLIHMIASLANPPTIESNLENKCFWEVSDYLIFCFSEDWSIKKSKKMLEVMGKIVWYSKTIWQGKMMKYCGRWVFLRNFRLSHIMLPERLECY